MHACMIVSTLSLISLLSDYCSSTDVTGYGRTSTYNGSRDSDKIIIMLDTVQMLNHNYTFSSFNPSLYQHSHCNYNHQDNNNDDDKQYSSGRYSAH